MAQYLSPFAGRQFLDANGDPYAGALLFTYAAGSSTKVTTTKDSAGASNHTNPIELNARGEPSDGAGASQAIWQPGGTAVKYVLAPSTDSDPPLSAISTWDNISGINDASTTIDQWIAGPTPTYVGATQFTLAGDQTSTFHVGRRIKATVTAGTVYGTITVSAYTALTTITVVLDSGNLDSGLSAVYYGILTATNSSIPGVETSGDDWTHQGNVTHEGTTTHLGTVTMTAKAINMAEGAAVVSAATCDIWAPADGNTVHVTGSTGPIVSFGTAPQAGAVRWVIFDSTPAVTHDGSAINILNGGISITVEAGDVFRVYADTTTQFDILHFKASGSSAGAGIRFEEWTAAGTYTNGFTAKTTSVWVDIVAGGGGGGGTTADIDTGGGGAGGGFRGLLLTGLTIGASYDVVVGAKGTGVFGGGATAGGASKITVGGAGATLVQVGGGDGATDGDGTNTPGVAGTSSTHVGSVGGDGAAGAAGTGGRGGASIFGLGAAGTSNSTNVDATNPGSGGGGCSGANGTGGDGADGYVRISW